MRGSAKLLERPNAYACYSQNRPRPRMRLVSTEAEKKLWYRFATIVNADAEISSVRRR